MPQFNGVVYKVVKPTIEFLVFSYLASVAAIILNIIEIRMIVKKWKKASDFEIVLLNLAGADLLSGFGFLAATGVSTWSYVAGMREVKMMTLIGIIIVFSVSSSVTFVIVIARERLAAVKHPLRHRLWHSNRRNLFKACLLTWMFNTAVVVIALITDKLVTGPIGSKNLAYAIAGYMTLGITVVFVLYTWLGYLIMHRSTDFLAVDKTELAANVKEMKRALKKERATIVVCILVVVLFLLCNIPFTVAIYQLKLEAPQIVLLKMNPSVNAVIYFFKGRLEKFYAKKKLNVRFEVKTPESKAKNAKNGTIQTTVENFKIWQSSETKMGAEMAANKEGDGMNETFHRSDTLKIGQGLQKGRGANRGANNANSTFQTMAESLRIGQRLATETGATRDESDANGTVQRRALSLRAGQRLETELGANRDEGDANGTVQTRADDISREYFDEGIVNKAYDTDSLNMETTRL